MAYKKRLSGCRQPFYFKFKQLLIGQSLLNHSFKCFRIVQGEIGKHFPVDLDVVFVQLAHKDTVRQPEGSYGCIDTHNPQGAERAFLVAPVAIGILLSFFVRVFGYGPNILPTSKLTPCQLENLFLLALDATALTDLGIFFHFPL